MAINDHMWICVIVWVNMTLFGQFVTLSLINYYSYHITSLGESYHKILYEECSEHNAIIIIITIIIINTFTNATLTTSSRTNQRCTLAARWRADANTCGNGASTYVRTWAVRRGDDDASTADDAQDWVRHWMMKWWWWWWWWWSSSSSHNHCSLAPNLLPHVGYHLPTSSSQYPQCGVNVSPMCGTTSLWTDIRQRQHYPGYYQQQRGVAMPITLPTAYEWVDWLMMIDDDDDLDHNQGWAI